MTSEDKEPIGSYLIRTGVLSEERVQHLLTLAGDGERLLSCALAQGAAPERPLARALAIQLGHPVLVFSASSLDLTALQLVPQVVARTHRVLAIAVDDNTITLAAADHSERAHGTRPIFDQIAFATGRSVVVVLALEAALLEASEAAYTALDRRMSYLSGEHAPHHATPGNAVLSMETAQQLDPAVISNDIVTQVDFAVDALSPVTGRDEELGDVVVPVVHGTSEGEIELDVLLIEDDPAVSDLVRKVLSHDSLVVEVIHHGQKALQRLREIRPRLIILDAMLPEVHGFDICRALKASETFAQTPVVMVSAVYKGWQHAHEIQEVHGADVFIEKPFDVHYLRKVVAEQLGRTVEKTSKTDVVREKIGDLLQRADTCYREGRDAAAESLAQQVRALDPFHPVPWLLIGNLRTKSNKLDQAMHAYERAATFAPELFSANKNLALVYESLGFQKKAVRTWRTAMHCAPSVEVRTAIEERLQRTRALS